MLPSDPIWVISPGAFGERGMELPELPFTPRRVFEYRLSELGRYLLSPAPVTFDSCLVGCEVHRAEGRWARLRRRLGRWRRNAASVEGPPPLRLTARHPLHLPGLRDHALAEHLQRLRAALAAVDPVVAAIQDLDGTALEEVVGVCEEFGGQQTRLTLKGTPTQKLAYVERQLMQPVRVTLKQAHLNDGLYELRGFDFLQFDPARHVVLLKLTGDEGVRACVLTGGNRVDFWVEDLQRVNDVLLLQQVLQADGELARNLEGCRRGAARPLRLLFNRRMDIDYSRNRLPGLYQDLFRALRLTPAQREQVVQALNQFQVGVSLSHVESAEPGLPRALTRIAVLHNVRALEALRGDVPELYSQVAARASHSEAGKYYLLESIQGSSDEVRV